MRKTRKIAVLDREIALQIRNTEDFICLTDIACYKESDRSDHVIQNWLRNRNTIEFLGVWEKLNNPDFKPLEFEGFKRQAGLNGFVLTAKQWREANPGEKGNIRDVANAAQLVCLSNRENLNALFIDEGLPPDERLTKLNRIAIHQMELLTNEPGVKRLEGK